MSSSIWTIPSGSIGTYQENDSVSYKLPIDPNIYNAKFTLISGKLPTGLYIENGMISGKIHEVANDIVYSFCIRATYDGKISDRTFRMAVTGPDVPIILTPSGRLALNNDARLYVFDGTYVDFQIDAIDYDTLAGQKLNFFIATNDGIIPPGLSLSNEGRITGYVAPVEVPSLYAGDGGYDTQAYDSAGYDLKEIQMTGYDMAGYDLYGYDMAVPEARKKRLNRNYPFIVTVTDGTAIVKSKFSIYVVTDSNLLRADATYGLITDVEITADSTYIRNPQWKTHSDLGEYQSDNYIIIPIETYDRNFTYYQLLYGSDLPPGMEFDEATGSVYGYVDKQRTTSKTYEFTIRATVVDFYKSANTISSDQKFTIKILGDIPSKLHWITDSNLGMISVGEVSLKQVVAESFTGDHNIKYKLSSGKLPNGLSLDADHGYLEGIPTLVKTTSFSDVTEFEATPTVYDNADTFFDYGSTLFEKTPTTYDSGYTVFDYGYYCFDNGMTMFDSEYTFEVIAYDGSTSTFTDMSFFDNTDFDIVPTAFDTIIFDNNYTTFDGYPTVFDFTLDYARMMFDNGFTVFDKEYIMANFITREFSLILDASIRRSFVNVNTKPFMPVPQRTKWKVFISDISIFPNDLIYRLGDPQFGVAPDLHALVYAGIEINELELPDVMKTIKSRLFQFCELKSSIAIDPFTKTPIYEVVYFTIIDPASGPTATVSQWRDKIKTLGASERTKLPLWMRTIQPSYRTELGFVFASPLCYCKVGQAARIMSNIRQSEFNYRELEFIIDRFIIEDNVNPAANKYIKFNK